MSATTNVNTIYNSLPDSQQDPDAALQQGNPAADLSTQITGQPLATDSYGAGAPTLPSSTPQSGTSTVADTGTGNNAQIAHIIGSAGSMLASDANTRGALAANEEEAQTQQWQSSMPYWFDPSRDVAPDINRLMSEMPTRTSAMDRSANQWYDWVLDPGTSALGAATGNKAFSYAASKGVSGMAEGATVGSSLGIVGTVVGGIAGGVIGILDGYFGYGDAQAQDDKDRSQRLAELQAALKEYNIERQKYLENQREAANTSAEKGNALAQAKKKQAYVSKKDQMMSIMQQFSNARNTAPQAAPTIGSPSIAG